MGSGGEGCIAAAVAGGGSVVADFVVADFQFDFPFTALLRANNAL